MLKLHAGHESAPVIDADETRWVAAEVTNLLRQMDPDSPAGYVLRQARRELESLVRSAEATASGPTRVAA